jgi:hypothetical protein
VEIVGEEQALHLFNPGAGTVLADVATLTTNDWLYVGGFAQVPPLPDRVTEPATMVVTAELPAGALVALPRAPVALWPLATGAVAYLRQYGPLGVALLVAGPGARLTLDMNKQRSFTPGEPFVARVVIESGAYPVAPGSRHQVKIDSGFGHQTTAIEQADAHGRLSVAIAGSKVQIEVAPESMVDDR